MSVYLELFKHPILAIISNQKNDVLHRESTKCTIKSLFQILFALFISGSTCFLEGKPSFTSCTEGGTCVLEGRNSLLKIAAPKVVKGLEVLAVDQGNPILAAAFGIGAGLVILGLIVVVCTNPPAALAVVIKGAAVSSALAGGGSFI